MEENKKELYELSAEISGISRILDALSFQFDKGYDGDTSTPESVKLILFGVCAHLDRIAEELL